MDNLLFTALCLATLYYFCYYLPQQKLLAKQTISTQTEPFINPKLKELESKNQTLETELKQQSEDYQNQLRAKNFQITKLQTEISKLGQRPLKPTHSKLTQTDPETELTNTLANLIKDIQEFNQQI